MAWAVAKTVAPGPFGMIEIFLQNGPGCPRPGVAPDAHCSVTGREGLYHAGTASLSDGGRHGHGHRFPGGRGNFSGCSTNLATGSAPVASSSEGSCRGFCWPGRSKFSSQNTCRRRRCTRIQGKTIGLTCHNAIQRDAGIRRLALRARRISVPGRGLRRRPAADRDGSNCTCVARFTDPSSGHRPRLLDVTGRK
jgi:hypothetical protein